MSKKIIAVFGATGAQGGGLARAILTDKNSEFTVRAITRDINTPQAIELAKMGADVVSADLEDPDSLQNAFQNAYGAYCVTFFWAHFSPEKEKTHALNMAQAAKKAKVQHVIWSTLEDTRKWIPIHDNRMPTLLEKYKVPHFDAKGEADDYFKKLGVPTTFLLTTFYWENFIHFGMGPRKTADGNLVLTIPMSDKKLAGIAAEDIGKCAYGIFKKGKEYIGKTIGISGENLSGDEMALAMSSALKNKITYQPYSYDEYRNLKFPGADDLGNMFQFYSEFNDVFIGTRNPDETKLLNSELKTFDSWLSENANQIPLS